MWPHRQQPTRLPHPWDSPGKNPGVDCHLLLQCMKVKSEREVAQSCPTLHDPMGCSLPGSSVHGIFQARGLEWGAIAFSAAHLKTFESHHSHPLLACISQTPEGLYKYSLHFKIFIRESHCQYHYTYPFKDESVPYLLYPFLCWWTFRWLPCPGYC